MAVPGQVEGRNGAVDRPGDDDGELRRVVELALDEEAGAGRPAEALDRARHVTRRRHPDLTPPVVAADRGLEPQRRAEDGGRLAQARLVGDLAPRRGRHAQGGDEAPFGEPILGHPQRTRARPHRDAGRLDRVDESGVDVLQLVGDDGTAGRQGERPFDGVVGGRDHALGDRGGRAIRVGVEDRDPVAHRPGGEPQHPPQLASAEDPDRGAGGDRGARTGGRDARVAAHDPRV